VIERLLGGTGGLPGDGGGLIAPAALAFAGTGGTLGTDIFPGDGGGAFRFGAAGASSCSSRSSSETASRSEPETARRLDSESEADAARAAGDVPTFDVEATSSFGIATGSDGAVGASFETYTGASLEMLGGDVRGDSSPATTTDGSDFAESPTTTDSPATAIAASDVADSPATIDASDFTGSPIAIAASDFDSPTASDFDLTTVIAASDFDSPTASDFDSPTAIAASDVDSPTTIAASDFESAPPPDEVDGASGIRGRGGDARPGLVASSLSRLLRGGIAAIGGGVFERAIGGGGGGGRGAARGFAPFPAGLAAGAAGITALGGAVGLRACSVSMRGRALSKAATRATTSRGTRTTMVDSQRPPSTSLRSVKLMSRLVISAASAGRVAAVACETTRSRLASPIQVVSCAETAASVSGTTARAMMSRPCSASSLASAFVAFSSAANTPTRSGISSRRV